MLESEWTKPRAECPHPERWTTDDGESTEHQVTDLVADFITALKPSFVLETGTAFGQTAEAVGRALAANGHGRLVTLEPDPERRSTAVLRCEGLPVSVLAESSLAWEPTEPIDFMWLDSLPHLRPLEIQRFRQYASPSCVLGIHDTATHSSIADDLDRLAADGVIVPPLYLPTPRGVCFTRYRSMA